MVLCTESHFPEDCFVDTDVASHDGNARGETLDTPTDGNIFSTAMHINLMSHAVSC